MKSVTVQNFRFGLDTRRGELTSQLGTLETIENAHVTSGAGIEKRLAFVQDATTFPTNCFGLQDTDTGLRTFGAEASANAALPTGVTYMQLAHPTGYKVGSAVATMTAVPFSINFQGKAFVAATFDDGNTYLYYNGTLVGESRNGLVLYNSGGVETTINLAADLAAAFNAISGWSASNTHVIAPSSTTYGGPPGYSAITYYGTVPGQTYTWTKGAGATNLTILGGTPNTLAASGTFVAGLGNPVEYGNAGAAVVSTLTVTNNVVTVTSPLGVTFSPTITENAAGTLTAGFVDQQNAGVPGSSPIASFTLNNGGIGTDAFTVTYETTSGAGPILFILASNVICLNTSADTATAVVNTINAAFSQIGFSASSVGNLITVAAPLSEVGKNYYLIVNATGSGTSSSTTNSAIVVTPPQTVDVSGTRVGNGPLTINGAVAAIIVGSGYYEIFWQFSDAGGTPIAAVGTPSLALADVGANGFGLVNNVVSLSSIFSPTVGFSLRTTVNTTQAGTGVISFYLVCTVRDIVRNQQVTSLPVLVRVTAGRT